METHSLERGFVQAETVDDPDVPILEELVAERTEVETCILLPFVFLG